MATDSSTQTGNDTVDAHLVGTTFETRFDSTSNNLVSLRNRITGDEYIKSTPHAPMVTLYGWENRKKVTLTPANPTLIREGKTLVVQYARFGDRAVQVALRLTAEEDRLTLSARIENQCEGLVITEVLMPRIGGIVLGDDFRNETIIYPHHAGERSRNPVFAYGKEKKDFWRASSKAVDDYYRREINYCGLASMSWMYLYDAENGLYIGSHDARFPVTGVIAETSGQQADPWMAFAFRKYKRIAYGEQYDTGEYQLAISTEDWHYGAQLYRRYLLPHLEIHKAPAFLQHEYALNQCYNFKRRGAIENYFRDIPRMYDAGAAWGARHMFIASWNRTGFDSFYPEYYPDMELGSAMEFRRGLEYVRQQGGFSTLYINTRIFDVKSDYHPTIGERMAVRTESGDVIRETYGPEHFTVNCPADALWRDYILDTAEFTVKAYGADGIYLDQLASAEPLPCFAPEHSHADIGEFNQGYLYVLRNLLERLRQHNPNAYIMVENCGDIYGAYTWGNLTWNGAEYDEHYNVFKYTFPEFVQVNMVNPRGWEPDQARQIAWLHKDLQRAALLGSIFWMGITTRLADAEDESTKHVRAALAFRKATQPLLENAEFLDDDLILAISDDCDATSWRLADGSWMVLAGNHALRPDGSVTIQLPEKVGQVCVHDIAWHATTTPVTGESVTISLAGSRLFCIQLVAAGNRSEGDARQ